jgi:Protein of unknown function (DUF3093)
MRDYHERLRAPAAWWLLGELSALIFASFASPSFGLLVIIASYVVFCGGCAVPMLVWGHATIEVAAGQLRAGAATLPLCDAGEVVALDEAQARALRGPRADPTAFMLLRPYLKLGVYIEITGEGHGQPYWLIGTRHPAELAAAIERSRSPAEPAVPPWDDRQTAF